MAACAADAPLSARPRAPLMRAWLRFLIAALLAVTAAQAADMVDEGTLPSSGLNLVRERGGWINIAVDNNRLVATFFDTKKKPVPPDVARAKARIVHTAREARHVVLNRTEKSLASPPTVRPPHVFRVFLMFFAEDATEPVERYSFGYPR